MAHAAGISLRSTLSGAGFVSWLHGKTLGKGFTDDAYVGCGWSLYWGNGYERRPESQLNRFIYAGYPSVLDY